MFDEKIYYTIESWISAKGWTSGNSTHIGDNIFEIEITESSAPFAGRGGTYTFKVEESEVKIINRKNIWMS